MDFTAIDSLVTLQPVTWVLLAVIWRTLHRQGVTHCQTCRCARQRTVDDEPPAAAPGGD